MGNKLVAEETVADLLGQLPECISQFISDARADLQALQIIRGIFQAVSQRNSLRNNGESLHVYWRIIRRILVATKGVSAYTLIHTRAGMIREELLFAMCSYARKYDNDQIREINRLAAEMYVMIDEMARDEIDNAA